MSNPSWTPGHFVWRELMTKDVAAAKGFYGELFGWKFQDEDMGEMVYTLIQNGGVEIGGMMASPEEEHPPSWMSYVSVPNVDEAAAAAKAAGGAVAVGPMDIPNVGRFAVISDPAGAYFTVCRWTDGDPTPGMPGEGAFCWETLSTSDIDGAFAFYEKVCGWQPSDTGPGGMKVFKAGDMTVADPQPLQGGAPPNWMTYVVAPGGAEASREKATKLGAQVLASMIEIPEVGKIAIVADPTGAVLGLFEPGA